MMDLAHRIHSLCTKPAHTTYVGMKINLIHIALASASLVLVSFVGFARTNNERVADQWFDSYGDLSWKDEKARLDNFAFALQNDPDLIGYIMVYAGRQSCVGEAKNRALRAKKYLVQTRAVEASRIKFIDGGYREELTVILQPAPRGAPEIPVSPTLKPSEVKIKNCKPSRRQHRKPGS